MNRRILTAFAAFAVVVFCCNPLFAQSLNKVTEVEGITEYRLDNGARVLLYPDNSSGNLTVAMTILVGSRHEGYGETGMAHLLEHLLFKGSLKHRDIPKEMKDRGATFNGTTWYDRTNYYETVPASDENLEWALDLESDRLVNSFVKAEDLLSEMTVVRNEFEIGENNPNRILFQRIMANAYEWHNYGKSTIGNRIDLERVPIHNLKRFYAKYYQPDNIVLVVAGKFDSKKALELIEEKFGSLPKPKRELEKTYTEEPPQDGERTVVLSRVGDVRVVGVGYHIPAAAHPDYAACQVLSHILGDEPGGILYKNMVEKKIATTVSTMEVAGYDPGMLLCTAQVPKEGKIETTKAALLDSVQTSKDNITKESVKRAVQQLLKSRENLQTNTQQFAIELSEWSAYGDWRLFFLHRDRLEKVSADDVSKVAERYLVTSNRTIGIFKPIKKPVRATVPSRPDIKKLVANYKGRKKISEGERLATSPLEIEKRITRGQFSDTFKYALLPKETRGDVVRLRLTLKYGNEETLSKKRRNDAADFLPGLWTRGTKTREFQALKDELNENKINFSASGGTGSVTFNIRTKRDKLGKAIEILKDVLQNPTFPEKEFEVMKSEGLVAVEQQKSNPQTLAFNTLMQKMQPREKSDIRYIPTPEESATRMTAVTRDDVVELYENFLSGTYGELTIVGDFDADEALPQIKAILADWKSDQPYQRISDSIKNRPDGEQIIIETPDKKNAIFAAGLRFNSKDDDDDYEALLIGNSILGGGALSNRLANRVRQKDGLSYMVQSIYNASSKDRIGTFLAVAAVNPKSRDRLIAAMSDEMVRLVESGVNEEELQKAKEGYLQTSKRQRTGDAGLLGMIHSQLSNDRTMQFVHDREERIRELTKADVDKSIKKMVDVKKLIIVTAGDFANNPQEKEKNDK